MPIALLLDLSAYSTLLRFHLYLVFNANCSSNQLSCGCFRFILWVFFLVMGMLEEEDVFLLLDEFEG